MCEALSVLGHMLIFADAVMRRRKSHKVRSSVQIWGGAYDFYRHRIADLKVEMAKREIEEHLSGVNIPRE